MMKNCISHLICLFKYIVTTWIFHLRCRLPLYADDRSRIYTAHAKAILSLSLSENLMYMSRTKLWDRYASNFFMIESVRRFHDTVQLHPRLSDEYERWVVEKHHGRFSEEIRNYIQISSCFRPLTKDELDDLGTEASLILSGVGRDFIGKTQCHNFKFLNVYCDNPVQKLAIGQLETFAVLNILFLSDLYTAQDSVLQIKASQLADSFGSAMAETLSEDANVSGSFPKDIQEDMALLISDLVYRQMINFEGMLAAICDMSVKTPVILTFHNIKLAPEFARRGFKVLMNNRIYAPDEGNKHIYSRIPVPAMGFPKKAWDSDIEKIDMRLERSLINSIAKRGLRKVFILCNRRSNSYNRAVGSITKFLGKKYTFEVFNVAAPSSLQESIFGVTQHELYSTLWGWNIRETEGMPQLLESLVSRTFDKLGLFDDDLSEVLMKRLQAVLENKFGLMITHGRLYLKLISLLSILPNSTQVLLLPGRDPTVRLMARAFNATGLNTIDVQVLFVSDMSRYKTPIANKLAVIDTNARDHFCKRYDYTYDQVQLIGSINLEDDKDRSQDCNTSEIFARYFKGHMLPVVTYALQPLSEKDLTRGLRWCAELLNTIPDICLIIKLHPAQTNEAKQFCESVILECILDKVDYRWIVLKDDPLHEIVALSDILLTHFSNVAMLAALHRIAVGVFPTLEMRPSIDLVDMKLAQGIDNPEELVSFVRKNSQISGSYYADYLSENAHIVDGCPLEILSDMLNVY